MARDNFDESKNKKKKKAATTTKSQSSSVTKTNPTVNRVNDRAQGSTFLSGGGSTSSYQNQNQKPKTVKKPAAQKQTSTSTTPRQTTPQRTTDTGTGRRRYSRTEATDYNNNLKQTAARDSRTRARRTLNEVDDFARRTANRASAWEKENLSARNQMLETQRAAKNKKTAERASERMQNKYGKQELSEKQKAFSDYTSGVIQRKALGYAKTASDLLKTNEGYKAQGRWAQEDPEFARRISSHEFAKRADKAFNDYSVKQEEVQKRLSKIEDNASGAGKIALQAYGSGLEMGIDRLAGPMWAASMFASAYGNQRGQALKEGASDEQDSRAAFLGAGVEVATEYMFKPVAGIASKFGGKHSMDFAGKLAAKITSKLTGNKARIADIAVRTLGSQIEEGLEEVAGWAVDPYIQNAAYKNDLQKKKEADAHADYNDMQQSFWNQFDTEEEAQQAALYVNSDEFIDDQVKTYKESGATDEEARSMARILQKYFLAHFDNDEEAAEEAEAEMDRFVVGDVREKHDWKELGQTLASTFLLTGVTGGASTYYTNQIGNQMLQGEVGKDRVKQYTDIVIKYDPDNAKDAKYVKDTIDNGGTPTGTQVYQVASQATEVLQDMGKREMASDQVKQRRMRDEDLRVVPVVMTARGPQFNEMTSKAYQASYDKALGVVRGVRKHGTDVGLSEDTLTSPEVMRTAANAVAAYETGTITAEQINDLTIDNPEIRTIFELATGVDLAQYNVMKRGKIDEVASNNAMMNGLLANAADNYVQMARAEQKQWSNRTRGRVLNAMSTSFGEKGNLAMHDVLKAADPRDQQKYMLTARIAQNVYDYARRTDISWEKMRNAYKGSFKNVDIDAMKDVYDAAKMDKDKAETAYLGREVIAGEAMRFEKSDKGVAMVTGQFSNDSARELTGEEDEAMRAVADRLGVNIRIVPDSEMTIDEKMSAGENAENVPHFNGSYDSATNTILLAETNGLNDNILYAMSHETTHLLKQYAPDAYMKLSNYIMDKYYKSAPGKYEAAIKAKQDLYKRAVNQELSEEAALEEIIADATRDFWSDPEFVNQISNDIEEPGFFKSIVNAIRDMLRHIRNLLSSGHFDGTEHEDVLWDLLGTYSKAEKLWLDAYRQAARNRAQIAIDELQDRANKQNSPRLSVPETDSEGNTLSEGQREFFKDSKVRDDDGKLIRMYHGTYEEFTVFEPNEFVEEQNGLSRIKGYFSTSEDYSSVYGDTTPYYLNMKNPLFIPDESKRLDEWKEWFAEQGVEDIAFDSGIEQDGLKGYGFEDGTKGYALWELFDTGDYWYGDGNLTERIEAAGYDGIYWHEGEGWNIGDGRFVDGKPLAYMPFNQNAIKRADNLNPTEDVDTRFSLSGPVERVADLIAVHNLNEEDLVGDLSLGGFPMPSIAITKDSMGHDKYGSISLLFHSSTIDPSVTNANQVFGGDAYTPTFPRIHYKANSAVSKKLIDMYYKKSDELGYETMRPMYEYAVTIDDTLDRAGGEKAVIERAKKDIGLKRLFLRLNDKDVEDVTKTTTTSLSDAEVARNDFWINELGKEAIQEARPADLRGRDAMHHFAEWRDERIEDLKKIYEKLCREVYGFDDDAIQTAMSDEKAVKKEISSNIIAAINYMKNGKDTVKTEIDYDATWKLVEDAAKENGYDAWVDDLFKGIEEKSGIRNDKDLYTPAGNMRSWESLHEPVTLDNVVKQMKKELDSGGGTFLGNNPVGAAQKKYKSLDEIRADEDRLQYLDDENYGKLREVATAKLSKVSHEIYENSPKRQNSFAMFGAIDVGSDIAEALNKTRNKDKLKKILERDYSYNVSEQNMDDLMDALHDLANLPTGYFEAKPKRAVWFDEVKAAIVPKEFPDHLKAQLSNYGTSIYEYDPEVDGDRTQKINDAASENDLRFSISAKYDDAYMNAVNSGNMDEAQRLVDEAADKAGMRVAHRYHGTMNAGFTVFDKAYAKVGGNSGAGFYFSTEEDDSVNHYADVEGADNYYKWSSLAEHINQLIEDDAWDGPELETYEDIEEYAKEQLNKNPGTYDVYLNYKNPYIRDYKNSTNIYDMLMDDFDESVIDRDDYEDEWEYEDAVWEAKAEHLSDSLYSAVYGAYQDIEDNYEVIDMPYIDEVLSKITEYAFDGSLTWEEIQNGIVFAGEVEVTNPNWTDSGDATSEFTRAIIENLGFDAIEDKEVNSKFGQLSREMMTDTEHIIVFKPEQIKLSDPVTYAEDGSVIPLSERFDPTNNDIRYSLPTQDSDGNILTDGQMEYFKNSQARDEQGRLVPVYHTTNRGGFTIFDPWYSNDHRSLFFASNWDVSQTYGYRAGNPINLNPGNRIYATWAEVENDIRKRFPEWLEVEDMISPFLPQETMKVSEALNAFVFRKQDNQYADELGVEDGFDNWIEMSESGEDTSDYYVELTIPKAQGFVDIQADNLADLLTQLATELETGQGKQRGYYSVYLNLENPMIVDAQGQNWDAIPYGEYSDDAVLAIKNLTVQDMGNGIYVNIWGDRKVNGEWEDFRESDLFDYETSHDEIPDAVWDNVYDFLLAQGLSEEVAERYSDATFYNFNGLDTYDKDGKKVESAVHRYRTRDLARIAQNEGHDGVIIKNCYDLGGSIKHGANPMSDIYIAFSSNQVKDINNENPTENPDIRYSIPPEADVDNYISQTVEDINDIPMKDALLEQNRVEHMSAAEAFTASVSESWGRRTANLDSRMGSTPLKNQLISLMKQVRKGSDTKRQYEAETLDETIKSVKAMYGYAMDNKPNDFAQEAWKAAERIVDDIDYNDDLYEKYKELKAYFEREKIAPPSELYADEVYGEFEAFKRENDGKIRWATHALQDLQADETELEQAYHMLHREYPMFFTEAYSDNPIDQLMQMAAALNNTDAYRDAYTSEEHAKLVADIANSLCDIISEGKEYHATISDLTVQAMAQRHKEALRKVKEGRDVLTDVERNRANMWKERYNERIQKEKTERKEKADKREHLKSYGHIAKNYKKLCDWVLKPTKEKNVPEEFRKALAEFLQALDLQTENSKKLEAKTGRVAQKTLQMRTLKDKLNALATSGNDADGNYISSVFEVDAKIAFLLQKLSDKLDENGNTIDALDNDDIATIDEFMKLLIRNIERYKQVKTETKMAEISDVGGRGVEFLKAKIDRDGPYSKRKGVPGALQTINATALTPPYLFERLGPIKEMYDALRHNGFDTYIRNEKMIIDRLSDILGKYNRTNRKGQNMPGSIVEEWRDERSAQTIQLTYGSVTMSVAQMMSLYCLSKRGEQALGHMLVGGIKTTPIQTTSKIAAEEKEKMGKAARLAKRTKNAAGNYVKSRFKGETETAEKLVLTYDDVQTIISKLTPDQKDVADKLQNLMSVDMAKLGNEAHRELYGYEMFDEDFYFPIKVDSNQRETDINTIGEVFEKIKSFGFAKPLTPNANKAIIIDDIFSIVADHCNGMNLYNSYLVPITDFMKVLNYTHTFEDGTTLSMKDAIEQAYGKDMLKYVLNLMKDINGIKAENRGGLEGLMNKAIGKAKKTAVFGNVRVALQQPTAIVRAAMEINPKYLKGVSLPQTVASYAPVARYTSKAMEEMWKYCPIAQWKAWGYYDTYMGKDIEDVMMNNWSIGDDILSGYYGQLDNATWAVIWQAVKAEQADLHKDMDTSSEEFLQMCGRRASEVFDKTQVVDSTFHRSDAMRSKQVAVKIFTAFMAEPTLTLNVFRAGLYNFSEEWKAGNKGKAKKILGKAVLTIIAQGILVSAAQAFADAWRGKDPGLPWGDDDDDEEKAGYWTRWVHNFVYNCFDQLHLENNMYLVKDVTPYINYMISMGADHWNWNPTLRAVMGWDQDYLYSQNNLVFAALENTANGMSQAFKKLEKGDEYVDYKTKEPKRWYDINQKIASGIGTLIGFPAGTVMRDFKPIWDKIFPVVFAADTELMDNIANKMGYKPIEGSSRSTSPDNTDKSSVSTSDEEGETNVPTRESLPDNLTDEQKDEIIKSAEKRSKKATPEEEQGQLDYDTMLYNALKAASGLEGEEYNKKVYSSVANGLKGYIADGDYVSIGMMRTVIEEAGGDVEYFDKRVMEESKTAYKKVLAYDQTLEERNNMKAMYRYMMSHGMTQEELSNDVLYSSELAKDMKVAYRFGDNNMIYEAMLPLVDAGITRTDLERLYENRNKMDLAKYKKTGRYKDKLKSMGTFIWPATGPITSHFGYRTDVASVGGSTDHPAIDIGIPVGTPVVAADGGVVIHAGSNYGYGYSVGIKHDNGMVTYYNHLDSWNVKVGDTVAQGQQIACSGNTGRSTGPHLDFKILDKNGKPVDPEKLLSGSI